MYETIDVLRFIGITTFGYPKIAPSTLKTNWSFWLKMQSYVTFTLILC